MTSRTVDAATARSAELAASIASRPEAHPMLTGDRPTGDLHIGHYLSSLRTRVDLQNRGVDSYVLIADYQVITDHDGVGSIKDSTFSLLVDYLAAGIDPALSTVFTHSALPALNQLMLPFLSLVALAELQRNPTVKDELRASRRPLSGLLLTYPVHQAADILFCKADVVPVGRDQLPHLEQTRVIARRFNAAYADEKPVFPEPSALINDQQLILGVDGEKMSKSRGNAITLAASADETANLITRARTDAEQLVTYEPERRPEVANLLTIAAGFTGSSPEELATGLGASGGRGLKALVIEAVNEGLREHRRRRLELSRDRGFLQGVLRTGNARAEAVAAQTLTEVRAAMSMDY
ncbi:tryptophan--tRNA ligase [Microbacterium horticulturae]|uniref:Tryptophan--tRNA ligase n=1 Tax=Microbacterium horticulturae TaxID=3028316 RepID=A0ABY8C275_9MICO|nr:tryptophan--tRNA ligase [Microbacterium sp. KACC 23027]WEG10566.1 tryptophan--tRNA ligase [Microbacterium sp. KACC 23027]